MRLTQFALAGALVFALTGSAFAMGDVDYTKIRAAAMTTPALVQPGVGNTVELTGVVNGLFSDGGRAGFLLRPLDGSPILILTMAQPDRDLTIGATLNVVAREPQAGVILDALAITPIIAPGIPAQTMQPVAKPVAAVDASDAPARPVRPVVLTPAMPKADPKDEPKPTAEVTEPAVPELSEMVRIYADRIQTLNRRVDAAEAQRIAHYIIAKSEKYGVDPRLTFALVKQESNFSRTAVSHAGARGLGQLMPGTAVGLKVYDSFDIEQNLDGTVHYLKGQLDRFGRVSLALAAYNAGPGRVQRAGNAVPNIAETQHYVQVIWRDYCTFAGLDPASGEPAQG